MERLGLSGGDRGATEDSKEAGEAGLIGDGERRVLVTLGGWYRGECAQALSHGRADRNSKNCGH